MLVEECSVLTPADLGMCQLTHSRGVNVYGFGGFNYKVRFGTRIENRRCNDYYGVGYPQLLSDAIVVVIRLDHFSAISTTELDSSVELNEFELRIHECLSSQSPEEELGFRYVTMQNSIPDYYSVGLVIPRGVLEKIPGGVIRLPYYGVEVGTAECIFPDTKEISAAKLIAQMLSEKTFSGDRLGDMYGTCYLATSTVKNVWWMYDPIEGARPLQTMEIEGSREELIRYSRWYNPTTGNTEYDITVVSIAEIGLQTEKEQTETFKKIGLFRTENEAIASNQAHSGLLDHRIKYRQLSKLEEDSLTAKHKQATDELYRQREWEIKKQEADAKLEDRPASVCSSWISVLKGFVETVVKVIAGATAAWKLLTMVKS